MTAALTSWRDGPAEQAVVGFVASATRDGREFIPAADRIATFDNDGTLWVEQPVPPWPSLREDQAKLERSLGRMSKEGGQAARRKRAPRGANS